MKIKYRNSDGAVIATTSGDFSTLASGESAEDYTGPVFVKSLDFYVRKGVNQIEEVSPGQQEIIVSEAAFNINKMLRGLYGVLPTLSTLDLRFEVGGVLAFTQVRDFEGLKGYLDFLILNKFMTEDDFKKVNEVFLEQKIDLSSY